MPPDRIMFIRHAEKPADGKDGVTADDILGTRSLAVLDTESLTVRGWQRAGALIAFFCAHPKMKPSTIFASGIGHDSKSKRPMETVTPLAARLKEIGQVTFNTAHLKDDVQPLMNDVLSMGGTVLVCWEHKHISQLAARLPATPPSPEIWPDDRFDVVWIFDRTGTGWSFSQMPQRLLSGDSDKPIK
jgi:broad specificity phosphatase PhoE